MDPQSLLEKIKSLPGDRIAEIEDLVEFIIARERAGVLARAASAVSESAFGKVWNNLEDEVYDAI